MKIFLDTNIFHNDWFMKNANFKYLFHFISNENHEFLVSKLVIQEVENNRKKELNTVLNDLKKNIKHFNKLNSSSIDTDIEALAVEYNLLALIENRLENVILLDYSGIAHDTVVHRALNNKKPFMKEEKGYRDTLIWLSFIEYLDSNNITEEVAFITANKSDFFLSTNEGVVFHNDLLDDLKEKNLHERVKPFKTLYDFVKSTIDKNEHAIDYRNGIDEGSLEDEGISYLELLSNDELMNYLEQSPYINIKRNDFPHIEKTSIDLMEGLEDLEFLNIKELSGDDVYVQCRYNLRRVIVELEVSELNFMPYKALFENQEWCLRFEDGSVIITYIVRAYYDASFVHNTMDRDIHNFEVDYLILA